MQTYRNQGRLYKKLTRDRNKRRFKNFGSKSFNPWEIEGPQMQNGNKVTLGIHKRAIGKPAANTSISGKKTNGNSESSRSFSLDEFKPIFYFGSYTGLISHLYEEHRQQSLKNMQRLQTRTLPFPSPDVKI
jgi:hypothetical protein